MKSGLQCKIQVSALIQRTWNESLMLSIRPNPAAWAWGYRSAVPSLKVTADGSGPYRTTVPAQRFDLLCMGLMALQKSKLKGCAGTVIRFGPEPSTVTFNDGTADRQAQAQAVGFRTMESVK